MSYKEIKNRVINDYFMKNRYAEYEKILTSFLNAGYKFIMVKDYGELDNKNEKHIVLRHDIDSDINIAKKMFEIEKKLNIKSTYYFRISTLNKKFIKEINEYGSEVGYHYEEIAQFCKDNNNISKIFVEENIDIIKNNFIKNVLKIEKENDLKLASIVAHGEFINRKLGLTNKYIYQTDLQEKLKLIEAYDIEDKLDFRTADTMYPKFWKENPLNAIKNNSKNVLLLVHPRWYDKAPLNRFKLDLQRLFEEIKFKKYLK